MSESARYFLHQHPVFKDTTKRPKVTRNKKMVRRKTYEDSIYFLWWCFLRESDAYKKCCQSGGQGTLNKLFLDFGDVHATDFENWWKTIDRGANLFSEPTNSAAWAVDSSSDLGSVDFSRSLVVVIPIMRSHKTMLSGVARLLRSRLLKERGRSSEGSGAKNKRVLKRINLVRELRARSLAKYRIHGEYKIESLRLALRVFQQCRTGGFPMWKIGDRVGVLVRSKSDTKTEEGRRLLTQTTWRYKRDAKKIIENVEKGVFPSRK